MIEAVTTALDALVGVLFALGVPLWLAAEETVHQARVSSR